MILMLLRRVGAEITRKLKGIILPDVINLVFFERERFTVIDIDKKTALFVHNDPHFLFNYTLTKT